MQKNNIVEQLKEAIGNFKTENKREKVGSVIEVFDGVVRVSGLSDLKASEMVTFPSGVQGVALNLEEESVGVIVLGDYPFVEGIMPAERGSNSKAARKARANALNTVSAW